jgi:phosphoglycerate dehydrogenase-like enzyme
MPRDPHAPIRIYIENGRNRPPEYQVAKEQFAAASARHPGLEDRLELTLGFDDAPDLALLAEAEILIGGKLDTKTLATRAPKLRWIHSTSAGVETLLPLDWLPAQATLTNSSGVHGPKSGEFALMAMMMLNDHMPAHMTSQRRHQWNRIFSSPIAGKTAVIVGTGGLGGAAAEKARLLGLRTIGVSRSGAAHEHFDRVVPSTSLAEVLPEADFLLLTCPLTPATRGLIDAAALDRLKKGAGLVNMARAAVVDYGALADRLESGALSGAVLDVFDPEPLPADARWWDVPNLVVVPHVSSDHHGHYIPRVLDVFFRNLHRYATGEALVNVVDRQLGY